MEKEKKFNANANIKYTKLNDNFLLSWVQVICVELWLW